MVSCWGRQHNISLHISNCKNTVFVSVLFHLTNRKTTLNAPKLGVFLGSQFQAENLVPFFLHFTPTENFKRKGHE